MNNTESNPCHFIGRSKEKTQYDKTYIQLLCFFKDNTKIGL
jgi:hypothetical protein